MQFFHIPPVVSGWVISVTLLNAAEPVWPKLPERDGAVMIPA